MRTEPTEQVVAKLADRGVALGEGDALEVFGRKGDWQRKHYPRLVGSQYVWEIDPSRADDLRSNLPTAKIRITDAFTEILQAPHAYDLIVVDNPQSVYGEGRYCEHFELFPTPLLRVARSPCAVILNVNVQPYGFHAATEWGRRRAAFYRTSHPEYLRLDEVAEHYGALCREAGFELDWSFWVPRNDRIQYFVFHVLRTEELDGVQTCSAERVPPEPGR